VTCGYTILDSHQKWLVSSYYHNKKVAFKVGRDELVPGFEDCIVKMKNGEAKEFRVAKGSVPYIYQDDDLIFQIRVFSVKRAEPQVDDDSKGDFSDAE